MIHGKYEEATEAEETKCVTTHIFLVADPRDTVSMARILDPLHQGWMISGRSPVVLETIIAPLNAPHDDGDLEQVIKLGFFLQRSEYFRFPKRDEKLRELADKIHTASFPGGDNGVHALAQQMKDLLKVKDY